MCSTSELASFAARLRRRIRHCTDDTNGGLADFGRLALELFALQFKHNAPYRRLCESREATLKNVQAWRDIPAAPTSAFKELPLSSLPEELHTTVFHSSGTTEQRPSRHYHDDDSLALYEEALWAGFRRDLRFQNSDLRLAILTPSPAEVPHSSLVHMFETIRHRSGAQPAIYLGEVDRDGSWVLQCERTRDVLRRAAASSEPLLLLGTAFSYVHLLDYLAERDLRFALPAGSCALETGGYKGRSRSLAQADLHGLIIDFLGVPAERIVCEYGMSELSSQAYDLSINASRLASHASRSTHHATRIFRFPPWARVRVISPETGREVGEDETGLIRVYDLANVYSVMAVQTEDLGIRCGDGFALLGRATLAEPRGCSLMAG